MVLARAAVLQPWVKTWRETLSAQLKSWIESNPPETGIHWYSNLEISLRAINWLQVLALAGDQLEEELRADMARVLYASGRHMLADLAYTVSSMRNNHLLGDALGLVALGMSFPGDRRAQRWMTIGHRLFRAQLPRHVHSDGSMIEDSLSYHRFVLEMLAIRVLLGGEIDREREALARAAQYLCRLGALDGPLPHYGDWDEGRVLASSGDSLDVSGSVQLALSLAGSGSPETWRSDHDEVAWYARPGLPIAAQEDERSGHDAGGGIARMSRSQFVCWLKAGSGPSHGHADLCSTTLSFNRTWIVGDPGSGSYNRSREERDYFRMSLAHSVLRLNGQDQLVPDSPFRWRHHATGRIGEPVVLPDGVFAWGYHDAYSRLKPGRRVCRGVLCHDDGICVTDWVEGSPGCGFELSIPLPPDAQWHDGVITSPDGSRLIAVFPGATRVIAGRSGSIPGSWSPTYASLLPATLVVASGTVDGPVSWQIALTDEPAARVEGDALVTRSGARLSVDWTQARPRMKVDGDR